MSTLAYLVPLVLIAIAGLLLWSFNRSERRKRELAAELERLIIENRHLRAEQSRAHALADEREFVNKIWRSK